MPAAGKAFNKLRRKKSTASLCLIDLLECALSLARDLAYIWPRCPHQYYLCATPPSGYEPYAFNTPVRVI
jgi:hypothetical protein